MHVVFFSQDFVTQLNTNVSSYILYNLAKLPHFCHVRLFKSLLSWYLALFNALKNINSRIYFLKTFLQRGKQWFLRTLWLVHEELNQELDDAVVQTHHLSVLHTLVEAQAFSTPQEVLSGVVGIGLHREGHRVELVAEEGEEVAVCDHSLGHERPGDVLIVPETCRKREGKSVSCGQWDIRICWTLHCWNTFFFYYIFANQDINSYFKHITQKDKKAVRESESMLFLCWWLTLVHSLGSRPGKEAGEPVGSEKDLHLIWLLLPCHPVSVVSVRHQVELGVTIACWVW